MASRKRTGAANLVSARRMLRRSRRSLPEQVLLDVAGYKNVDALPSHYEITAEDLEGTLEKQGIDIMPGTVVLIRTGTAQYWGENGSDHDKIGENGTQPASGSRLPSGWSKRRVP